MCWQGRAPPDRHPGHRGVCDDPCAESRDDIALYGRNKLGWPQSFLTLANGIPSHDTFRRVFMLIDPDTFEDCFTTCEERGLKKGSGMK
jgi:hypothetical protein